MVFDNFSETLIPLHMKNTSFAILLFFFGIFLSHNIAAQSVASLYVVHSYDVCGTYFAQIKTTAAVTTHSVTCYWGDGSSDMMAIDTAMIYPPDTGFVTFFHPYASPGTYTIKAVLSGPGGPMDSVTQSQDVQHCTLMTIDARVDTNGNCISDTTDPFVRNSGAILAIDSAGVPVDTIGMGTLGYYRAAGPPGTVYRAQVIALPGSLSFACGSSGIIYDTVPGTYYTALPRRHLLYECASSSPGFDLSLSATLKARSSPFAQIHRADLLVRNTACAGTHASVRFDFSPKYAFDSISSTYPYTYTVSGHSVTIDLDTVYSYNNIWLSVHLTPTVTLVPGDTVNSTFTVLPVTGDVVPGNNIVTRCDTVRLSWDPNAKSVFPTGPITAGQDLEYMLEFENTGNDTAYNIHILDTLSDLLDPATFIGGTSTHNVAFYPYSSGGYNIVKFDFPNIRLADSSNPRYNKGMVTFHVKARGDLPPGTYVCNRAGIYFDVNEVVMTNSACSYIPLPENVSGIAKDGFKIYPNPTSDNLTIISHVSGSSQAVVYDMPGRKVLSMPLNKGTNVMDVKTLPPGVYILVTNNNGGRTSFIFRKE